MMTTRALSPRLTVYRWLPAMIASIAHRTSGMLLVIMMPTTLWLLYAMARDESTFLRVVEGLHQPVAQLLLWLTGVALLYHFLNGVRFLLLDIGIAVSREAMMGTAKLVLAATFVLALLFALWIFNVL